MSMYEIVPSLEGFNIIGAPIKKFTAEVSRSSGDRYDDFTPVPDIKTSTEAGEIAVDLNSSEVTK